MGEPEILKDQPCPFCHKNSLTLMEQELEIPFFGKAFVFSMTCSNCKAHNADVEAAEKHDPAKFELEINGEEDMKIRVVKSSEATVKIPHVGDITPGPASNGFVSNVEGVLKLIKDQVDKIKDEEEDPAVRKRAKKLSNKIQDIIWGHEKCKLIIEDLTGNSAIISEKAKKTTLKKGKK